MSSNTESSPIDNILALVAELSFADKLVFNERLATALRKEGKSGKIGKAAKPKNAKDKPKREAAVGTLAWIAFVKHCKTEFADRFEGITLEKERLAIAKQIREEDKDAYDSFVADYKAEHGAPSADDASDGEDEAPSSPVVEAPKMSAAEKVAAMKAKAAASSAPKTAAVPAKKEAAPAPVVSAAPAKKEVKKAAPAASKKAATTVSSPKATAKKAAPAPKKEEVAAEDDGMPTKTIDGSIYFFDADTNGLWMREDDGGFGAWVGYFQDGNTDEPIRFTDAPDA